MPGSMKLKRPIASARFGGRETAEAGDEGRRQARGSSENAKAELRECGRHVG